MSESECDGDARAWREVGREQTMVRFYVQRDDLDEALYEIEKALADGDPLTEDHIEAARDQLDYTRHLVEQLTKLTDDAEPWDAGAGSLTPHGVLKEQLEDAGYKVIPPGSRDDEEG
jgi:hypothetical protein